MEQEKRLMESALMDSPYENIPIYAASVFTRHNLILSVPKDCLVFNRSGSWSGLKQNLISRLITRSLLKKSVIIW